MILSILVKDQGKGKKKGKKPAPDTTSPELHHVLRREIALRVRRVCQECAQPHHVLQAKRCAPGYAATWQLTKPIAGHATQSVLWVTRVWREYAQVLAYAVSLAHPLLRKSAVTP